MTIVRTLLAALGAATLSAGAAQAQIVTLIQKSLPTMRVLAEAAPDECFNGVGQPASAIGADGSCATGVPKTNRTDALGLAQTQFMGAPRYWIATGANVHCLAYAALFGVTGGQHADTWDCAGLLADPRTPRGYRYDVANDALTDLEPEFNKSGAVALAARTLRAGTLNFNTVGTANGVVIFAGQSLLGVTFFAFDDAGVLIGSNLNAGFSSVHNFIEVNGHLYVTVGRLNGTGAILRWRGSKATPFPSILQGGAWEVVGNTDASATHISRYGTNRLAVTTAPPLLGGAKAGIYLSPPFTTALAPAQANAWTKVWSVDNYEPNPDIAGVLKGGALAWHDGWLYWGTEIEPGAGFLATLAAELSQGANIDSVDKILTAFYASWRATSVFRSRNLDAAKPTVELLYGEEKLPVYNHVVDTWTLQKNAMGQKPKYGAQGFGNPYNNALLAARSHGGKLYLGTMDSKQVLGTSLASFINLALGSPTATTPEGPTGPVAYPVISTQDITLFVAPLLLGSFSSFDMSLKVFLNGNPEGGDIWRFDNHKSAAKAEDLSGLATRYAHAMRHFASDGTKLAVATGNPNNIHPDGGWDLVELGPTTSRFGLPW